MATNTQPMPSGTVIPLPGAAIVAPVHVRNHGRHPKMVTSLRKFRYQKQREVYERKLIEIHAQTLRMHVDVLRIQMFKTLDDLSNLDYEKMSVDQRAELVVRHEWDLLPYEEKQSRIQFQSRFMGNQS